MKKSMFRFGQSVTVESEQVAEHKPPTFSEAYEQHLKAYEGRLGLFCLGGQGSHIAEEVVKLNFRFTEIVVLNTDLKDNSKIRELNPDIRVFDIGKDSYEISGAGAGGRPEVAEQGFAEVEDEVRKMLLDFREKKMQAAFVTVGFGGGTGTGLIAPFLKLCREAGIARTIVLGTMPSLTMDSISTVKLAEAKLEEVQGLCDGIMLINNEWIYAYSEKERVPISEIMDKINLRQALTIGSFIEVMLSRARQNIDLNDLLSFITPDENNIARLFVLGKGIGRGENRVIESCQNALDAFYLVGHGDISGAQALLYHTLTVPGQGGAYPDELIQLVDYIEECTGTVLSMKKLGGGEADYECNDPEFTDDAMLQVLLVTNFDKTPLEAFQADLKLEQEAAAKKEAEKKRNREKRSAQKTPTPTVLVEKEEIANKQSVEFTMPEYGTKEPSIIDAPHVVHGESERTAAENLQPMPPVTKNGIFPAEYMVEYDAQEQRRAMERQKAQKASTQEKVEATQKETPSSTTPTEANEEAEKDASKEGNKYSGLLNS